MQVAYDVLRLLKDSKFHSGTSLANELKVSRSSIWKGIHFLRQLEVNIQAVPGRGYRWYQPFELLNQQDIQAGLSLTAKQAFSRIDVVNVLSSTNDYLIQRIPHGLANGTVCVAEAQTAGRGRMGKTWRSPFGASIYLSFYWRFPSRLHELSGLSLVLGLAIIDALKAIAPLPTGVGIKWPNDVWCHQSKLCGILLESCHQQTQQQTVSTDVVVGIGMNLNMPELMKLESTWTDLKQVLGYVPGRNDLIAALLNSIAEYIVLFQVHGFVHFMAKWRENDLLLEQPVQFSTACAQQCGIAQGVNERGELLIKIDGNLKAVRYGDVSVRPDKP
ncbi:MAG TPA: biotin--[acetyl-CoA-carboxylase] ligase [Candidatus Berkiella sp.]|nr:biotin--[acetyl-CoA-carboxylase] ligase [Candidatus Berkiella sp.]